MSPLGRHKCVSDKPEQADTDRDGSHVVVRRVLVIDANEYGSVALWTTEVVHDHARLPLSLPAIRSFNGLSRGVVLR